MPPTYSDTTALALTPDDREMIAYALRWLPFGSGDEYIFPQFGITPAVFYHRIVLLIVTGSINFIDEDICDELGIFCKRRIARLREESRIASLTG